MQLTDATSSLRGFLSELLRRKVLRVASAYAVCGWIILQVALALQSAMSLPVWFSTVVVSLLILGFPIAVVLAWFFEFTSEGINRTTSSVDLPLVKAQTTDIILAAMLALVLLFAIAQALLPRETTRQSSAPTGAVEEPAPATATVEAPSLGDKSIAVLPFENLSPDEENAYFAKGLTEELLNLLAQLKGLKVISRTSSFAFQSKELPVSEIARQLGVRHVLEGSVRRDHDELRITAQLIDAGTDTHIWSQTYERKIESVFSLQEEIALAIANALDVELSVSAAPRSAPTADRMNNRLLQGVGQALVEPVTAAIKSPEARPAAIAAIMQERAKDPDIPWLWPLFMIGADEELIDTLRSELARGNPTPAANYINIAWRVATTSAATMEQFKALVKEAGLVDYWKKHGWPDRCRPKGENDFECG